VHIAALILVGTGVLFVVAAAIVKSFLITRKEQRCTATTDGEVVGFVRSGEMFYPVIRYVVDGRVYERRTPAAVNTRKVVYVGPLVRGTVDAGYAVGQRVRVRYDPEKPTRWFVDGDTLTWTLVKIFAFVGAGLMALGVVFAVASVVTTG
jgi:hypothetical protein